MKKKVYLLFGMLAFSIFLIIIFTLSKDSFKQSKSHTEYGFAMGTSISVTLYDKNENLDKISDEIFAELKRIDEEVISWRSEVSRLYEVNSTYSVTDNVHLDNELYEVINDSLDICNSSRGALDITLRPLLNLWNIESATKDSFFIPSDDDIANQLENVGYENIKLTEDEKSISISKGNMIIDLGAVGKGYALDVVRDTIKKYNLDGCIVSVGGSVIVCGSKPDESEWKVGIRNPQGNIDDMIGYLTFPAGSDICVSTSGDYEKYIEHQGKIYHHIIDRTTGFPADSGLASVTVVCENGLFSDGLSTACFVLGYEKSLPILKEYEAEGIFIDKDNNIIVTEGLKNNFNRN